MKHLLAIIDGTWVSAADSDSERFSNAYNLNWLLDSRDKDGNPQVSWYYSGIGSDKAASPYLSGATARGIDHLTREAYINICSNFRIYKNNVRDKIYLFGFSRGAVVARALSGLIDSCGILKPDRMYLFPHIWDYYVNGKSLDGMLEKATYRNVQIEFLGLFDCVFGIRDKSGKFHTLNFKSYSLSSCVKNAVHIISMDESRSAFEPMLISGKIKESSHLEQIWMPGVHSDVGGTYTDDHLANISLITMADRIKKYTDLLFDHSSLDQFKDRSDSLAKIHNEHKGVWKYFSLLKKSRKIDKDIPFQYLHPAAKILKNSPKIKYKGVQANYNIDSSFESLDEFIDFVDAHEWESILGL